jgi:hypothetical protein
MEVPMVRRKIIDEHDARACLEEAARNGMTAGQWAREHGIDGRSLHAWKVNLARREGRTPLRLVELLPAVVPRRSSPMRVSCGPFVVEVPADFDEDSLVRLLGVVSTAC